MPLPTNLRPGGYAVDPRDLCGVALLLHPGDATYEVEIQRAPDSSGAPNTGAAVTIAERLSSALGVFVDYLPDDGVQRWYRMRHTDPRGETAGEWTDWQAATPEPVMVEGLTTMDARRRVDSLFAEDGVLGSTVMQRGAGVSARRIAKGHLVGTARNGDVITFPENFAAPPLVVLSGGITYEPRTGQWSGTYSSTLPQYEQREAVNLSASGFTLRARLAQKGGSTNRSHNFGANDLDIAGEWIALVLANAPANDDRYVVHFSVVLSVVCTSGIETFGEVVVAVDTMTDGVNWVQRATKSFSESDLAGGGGTTLTLTHETLQVTVTGVDSTDQIRLRIVSITQSGSPGVVTADVHAFDGTGDPDSGVTYTTATDIHASMTPDPTDVITWHAIEVDA